MVIALDPVLGNLGPFAVRWHGALTLAGVVAGLLVSVRRLAGTGVGAAILFDAAGWCLPAGVVMGHLVYVLGAWESFLQRPAEVWSLSFGTVSLWGALLGGVAAGTWALRHEATTRRRVADAAAPGLAVGIVLSCLGAFLDGTGQGLPTALPWATSYSNLAATAPDFGVPRHPVQAYEGLVALGLLVVSGALRPRLAPGLTAWALLALGGLARVAFSPVRTDPPFMLGVQLEAGLAGALAVYALAMLGRAAWMAGSATHGARTVTP